MGKVHAAREAGLGDRTASGEPSIVYASAPAEPLARFRRDVLRGLARRPKAVPSVHFYDARGSELFRRIMGLPEYYVTRVELEILERYSQQMVAPLLRSDLGLDVVDLGAGDATKTRTLLQHARAAADRVRFLPIDVSAHALQAALAACHEQLPWLTAQGVVAQYAEGLAWITRRDPGRRRLVLMLGSNVGNMNRGQTRQFFRALRKALLPGDHVLVGFDMLKDIEVLQRAYDDSSGVTAAFNANLLRRINRELDGSFDLDAFRHYATFSPARRAMESYLLSTRRQTVQVAGRAYAFELLEPVRTEVSCKYRKAEISAFAQRAGFSEVAHFTDARAFFVDALWKVEDEPRGMGA